MSEDLFALLKANFATLTMDVAQRQRLGSLASERRLARGRSLFVQGQPTSAFYGLAEGEIETRFTAADGTVSVLEHVQPPQLFGLAAFATGRPSAYEALARRPSRLWVLGPQAYEFLMDEVPGFARALLSEFAQRYAGTLDLLEASRHRSAEQRLALALAQLVRERSDGPPDVDGWQAVSATQADLAALANLSRQTVNTLLRRAVTEGRLRSGYGRLWVRP
jgi:CRP/FNR family transcriptional regulator, cyclic AMP receptor protein